MAQHVRTRRTLFFLAAATLAAATAGPALGQDGLSDEELRNRAVAREQTRTRQLEAEAVLRANMTAFETRVAEADRMLTELKDQHDAFVTRLGEVMQNDDGRRIASQNHQAGIVIMDWMDAPLMRETDFTARRAFADEMVGLVTARKQRPDVPYSVEPQQADRMDDVYLWARERASRLAERGAWLDDAVRGADASQPVEGVPTLAEAIEAFRKARRDLWAQATATGQQRARDEAEPQMTEAARVAELERLLQESEQRLREARHEIEIERMQFESRLRTREAEAIAATAEADEARRNLLAETEHMQRLEAANRRLRDEKNRGEAAGIEDEAEAIRLRQLAQSPVNQEKLRPFTTPGQWQPGIRRPKPAAEIIPMSLSAIDGFGALNRDEEGLRRLLAIINADGVGPIPVTQGQGNRKRHLDEMRPKWGFPDRFKDLTADQVRQVREVQQLLIELGPTMVELKLLAP